MPAHDLIKFVFLAGFSCLFACMGWANSAPTDITASNLTIAENSAIGTVIGEFNATDPDGDGNLTFRILPDAPEGFSPLLWLDAADPLTLYSELNRTNHAFSGAVAGWTDKSGRDQHFGQSTSSARPSTGNRMFNGLNVLDFNGAQWMKSNGDFSTGEDFSIYIFAKIDAVASDYDSLFCIRQNTPNFQIDAGHSSQFRARFNTGGIGTSKTFANSAQHQSAVWSFGFSARTGKVGISINGEALSTGTSYTTAPRQTTNTLNIFSNRVESNFPEGFVGEFIVVNNMVYPGVGGVQEYLQRKWLGETYDHDAFVLDTNGTLLTNRLLDFEADEQNQTIQIIASNGTRQSLPQEFTVRITDVEEDLDGDGVEDFYDSDSDGDGLSNLQEFFGRSDPLNSSSSNAAPSEINATGSLSFSESLALGAIAVDFNATDTNSDANLTYRVQPKIDISNIPGISGWFDASDMDSLTTDLSGNTVLSWENQVDSSVAMVAGNKPPSSGTYLNGLHALFFDRNETMSSKKGDDVWSPWTSDGSIAGSFSDGSFFLVFRIYEIQRTSLPDLGNWWGGHLPWSDGRVYWDIWKGGETNRIHASLTSGHENMVVSFNQSVTDSSRQFFKNGKLIASGSPVVTTVRSPVHFPSTYEEPQFLYGEMIFVRQNITHANREKIEGYLTHKWGLADQMPTDHPYAGIDFTIDENGSLRTAREFDYESDDHNYSVRIWATDEHNATTYEDFFLTLTDVFEDLDGDGIEDHNDTDIDGDGLTNAEELAYNSDPRDPSSSNRPPSDINASNLTIAENSSIGTVIGEFNATDSDGEGNFSYSLIRSPFLDLNILDELNITLWLDAADASSITHSSGLVSQWNDMSGNRNHATQSTSNEKPSLIEAGISGLPSLDFSEDKMTISNINMLGKTLLAVVQPDSVGGVRQILSSYSTNVQLRIANGKLQYASSNPLYGGAATTSTISVNQVALITFILGEQMEFSINGRYENSQFQRASSGHSTYNQIGTNGGSSERFDGKMGELIVLNSVNSSDRQKIEGYLANKWGLADRFPADHPAMVFSIDTNGTLTANQRFDYETDDRNYSITVRVTDDHNVSFDKNFTVTVTNVVEDLDGDGTEDHYDDDIDGDGLTNAEELAYNSDPWDANSSNRPPSDINASNLTIAENSASGTVIGEFNATDPDGDLNFTYQMLWATPKEVTREENLLAWFKFDEANGSVAENFGPVGSSGSLVSGALFERSEYKFGGGALKIPAASTARVTLDTAVYIGKEVEGYFSLSIWFKNLHDRSRWRALSQGKEFNSFVILSANSDNLGIYQTNNGSFRDSGYDLNVSSTVEWTNLVATFDGSTTKFYINSAIVGTSDRAPGTNIHVIGNSRGVVQPFAEYLDDFRVYEQPLSGQDVASIYGNGLGDYYSFHVDVNGTLRTADVFDFESDSNLSVSVRAFDEAGTYVDKNFSLVIFNMVEDLDGDGIEDHNDTDADGDGVSNLLEYLGRSDPMDVNSTNRRPSDINASTSLTIEENASIGTIIAEFNATDLDLNSSIRYEFSLGLPTTLSPKLWLDAMDLSTLDRGDTIGTEGPPENNQSIGIWQDKSGNNHHAVTVVGSPTYEEQLINGNYPAVSTKRDVMMISDSKAAFDGWDSMTISLVYQWPAGVDNHTFHRLLSKGNGDWNNDTWVLTTMNNKIHTLGTGIFFGLGNTYERLDGNLKNQAKSPKIISVVYDGSNGSMNTYSNGLYIASSTGWPASMRSDTDSPIILSGTAGYYDGNQSTSDISSNYFGEILIFREAVTRNTREHIEGYLAHKWGLVNELEPYHSYRDNLFSVDENGTLRTSALLDYETQEHNQTILVRAIDEWNATLEKQFIVQISDVFEDLDQDGIEDHNDTDMDGDGVANLDEYLWGGDPSDANDVNHRPSNIISQGSVSIAENSSIGSLVEQFSGVDAEGNESLKLSMLHFRPKLWLDAANLSSFRTNLGVDSEYPTDGAKVGMWLDQSGGSYHAKTYLDGNHSLSEFMPTYRESGFNGGLPGLEFNSSMMVVENSAVDFDGWDELTVYAVVQETSKPTWKFWFGKSESVSLSTNSSWWFVNRRPDLNPSTFDFFNTDSQSSQRLSLYAQSNLMHQPGVLSISLRGNSAVMKYNGTQIVSSDRSTSIKAQPAIPITLGATSNGSNMGQFILSEFLVLNDGFNDEEIEWMEARLAYKWDVNGSLPTAHPYANSAPPNYPPSAIFYLEDNGTLRTTTTFDYETDDLNYSITLRVTDDHNVSFDKNFTVTVTNVVEDLDGDGTEDYYDDDIDGDGLTNAEELAYNSDPWDANSSNRPPSDINASNLTIAENSAIGTVIGEFNATDPDGEGNFTYELVPQLPSDLNLSLWLDASDASTITASNDSVSQWADKSGNNYHAQQSTPNYMPKLKHNSINGKSTIFFDGSNDILSASNRLGLSVNPAITIFFVCEISSLVGDSDALFQIGQNDGCLMINGGSGRWGWRHNNGNKLFTSVSVDTPLLLSFVRPNGSNYSSSEFYLNGAEQVSSSTASGTRFPSDSSSSYYIGYNKKSGAQYTHGKYGEIIVINSDSVVFRQEIEGYLAQKWGLVNSLPNDHSYKIPKFALDTNGTLTANQTFDYETDDRNYSITVRATDDHNVSFDKNFTISVTNVVEDLDEDGTEDHYDDDIDGDKFTNAEELAYGSDPLDPSSVANAAPDSIDLNGTFILENQPIGTRVGQLIAHDPDTNATLVFSFVDGNGSDDNSIFEIDGNASVRTTTIFDYETDEHNYSIRIQVTDEHNFSIERSFTINLINVVEDNDQDGVEDHYDLDDDNDGFSDADELGYGSDPLDPNSVINSSPYDIVIKGGEILENQSAGSLVAKFFGQDKDLNDTLRYSLVFENSDLKKEIIEEEEQVIDDTIFPFRLAKRGGGLRTRRELDYETDDHNYTVRIRVSDDLNTSFEKSFIVHLRNIIEDMDGDKIEDHYDDDIDGDGFSNKVELENGTNPTDPYALPKIPILETYDARLDGNNTFVLSGRVQANGDANITDFGIIISPSIDHSSEHWMRGKGNPEAFRLKLVDSNLTGTIYYRSWAKNVAGYGVGPVKKVEILEPTKTWWGKSRMLANGWVMSNWFGLFRTDPSGWIYHEEMNWIYHSESAEDSVWLWKKGRGWLWTKEKVWPYLWSNRKSNWLYFIRGNRGRPFYFDYSSNSYEED